MKKLLALALALAMVLALAVPAFAGGGVSLTLSTDDTTDNVDSTNDLVINVKFASTGQMKHFRVDNNAIATTDVELYKDDVKVEEPSITLADVSQDTEEGKYSIISFTLKNLDAGSKYKLVILAKTYSAKNNKNETKNYILANNFEINITTAAPAVEPKITDGADQKVVLGAAATFRSDAEYADFQKVLVDDKEVAAENYTVKEGSTIVTLKDSYTKTLAVGKHTISIVSTTGTATAAFEIASDKVVQTGDSNEVASTVVMLSASVFALGAVMHARKREEF